MEVKTTKTNGELKWRILRGKAFSLFHFDLKMRKETQKNVTLRGEKIE